MFDVDFVAGMLYGLTEDEQESVASFVTQRLGYDSHDPAFEPPRWFEAVDA